MERQRTHLLEYWRKDTFAALLPLSRDLQAMMTWPLCLVIAFAVSKPMPALPPVMMQVCTIHETNCYLTVLLYFLETLNLQSSTFIEEWLCIQGFEAEEVFAPCLASGLQTSLYVDSKALCDRVC